MQLSWPRALGNYFGSFPALRSECLDGVLLSIVRQLRALLYCIHTEFMRKHSNKFRPHSWRMAYTCMILVKQQSLRPERVVVNLIDGGAVQTAKECNAAIHKCILLRRSPHGVEIEFETCYSLSAFPQ